ncbi:competence protein CoiA family protein [Clostridium perfringens]|uniref:competence protein CoiA family protein n=1 Tax=Clostridium perfringens TaxID=1502 RepID=UPI00297946EF|nr:competence protein CoiA family protein [Clostridium perfringens]MDM0861428.1 competence protein CoiA family protein [Clostridium perfringens]
METCNYKGKDICAYDITNNNYALNYELEKEWKIAGKNGELKCPECGLDVILKVKDPRKKVPHFAHKISMVKCNYYNEDLKESEEHKRGKMILYNYFKELYPDSNLRINHRFNNKRRTDIFIEFKSGEKLAVEYQRLGLDIIPWQERQKEYEKLGIKVLWILQGNEEYLIEKSKQIELSFFKQIMLNELDKLAVFLDIKTLKLILMKNMEYMHKGNVKDKFDEIFLCSYRLDKVKINEDGSISCDFKERYGLESNEFIAKCKKECEDRELKELQRKAREKVEELQRKAEQKRIKDMEIRREAEIQKELLEEIKYEESIHKERNKFQYYTGKIFKQKEINKALKGNIQAINNLTRYIAWDASTDDYKNMTTIFKYAYSNGNKNAFKIYDRIVSAIEDNVDHFNENEEVRCPYCNGRLIKRYSRYRFYVSCSNFSECNFKFSIDN